MTVMPFSISVILPILPNTVGTGTGYCDNHPVTRMSARDTILLNQNVNIAKIVNQLMHDYLPCDKISPFDYFWPALGTYCPRNTK